MAALRIAALEAQLAGKDAEIAALKAALERAVAAPAPARKKKRVACRTCAFKTTFFMRDDVGAEAVAGRLTQIWWDNARILCAEVHTGFRQAPAATLPGNDADATAVRCDVMAVGVMLNDVATCDRKAAFRQAMLSKAVKDGALYVTATDVTELTELLYEAALKELCDGYSRKFSKARA